VILGECREAVAVGEGTAKLLVGKSILQVENHS
jgi:hypothetical protein